jgi:murein DD-endopeptidase MepM/ murein hydrolase activator NlpD
VSPSVICRLRITTMVAAALCAVPALALDAHVSPAQPRQGDTISVLVTAATPPTITMGDRTYPAFDIGKRYRAFIPTSPLDAAGVRTVSITAGAEHTSLRVSLLARKFGVQHIQLPPGVKTEADPIELGRMRALKETSSPEKLWIGAFRAPAAGRISTPYGVRRVRNGVFLKDYFHRGIDFAPGAGAPVVAPAGGRVLLVGHEGEGFRVNGNAVGIDHGHGVVSVLLHLSQIDVHEGDVVHAGDRIGRVGSTGIATGPHLHWGFCVGGIAVDPEPWLRRAVD